MLDLQEHSHRRKNILKGEWTLVSPHRSKRPWQGKTEDSQADDRPSHDPSCYLCPGNTRVNGDDNPKYTGAYIFTNDYSALTHHGTTAQDTQNSLLEVKEEEGICKVICFSPDHSLTLPRMSQSAIVEVVQLWKDQYNELGALDFINYVQIFENKGEVMGCSNPHPHGQIWSTSSVPVEPEKEGREQLNYFNKHGRTLLGDYLKEELMSKERVIIENDHFVALVPFWAVWPYETMILSKVPVQHLGQFDKSMIASYAEILKGLTIRYDNLFKISFPYSAGIHQAPTDGGDHPEWHFHMHFYPPLLRSATVKKFMVGFEMLANPQRDITAEFSAKMLRSMPAKHYFEA